MIRDLLIMEVQKTESPIRIAHILGKMNGAGVESMVMNYYRHIDKSKIQFDFIVDEDSRLVPYEEIASLGGNVFEVPPYQHLHRYNHELTEILKKNHYSIVHSHINTLSVFPLKVAKRYGIATRIAHSHSTAAPGETMKNVIKNILRPLSKTYPTHYCSCSLSAGEWLFGKNITLNKPLNIVNNGIDVDLFLFDESERVTLRKELGIENNYVLGHTGRLCFQKNQEFLINMLNELLKQVPEAVLLLIGDGPEQKKLIKLARDYDILDNILFLGNKSDVHRYYNAMDVFVFPSRYEGFGISAIEAQASGMPVLLSDKVPEEACLTEKCTVLSIENGVESWVDTLFRRKEDKDRDSIIDFEEFNISNNVEKLEEYYLKILNESVMN